jgi:hypothetical protein
MKQHKQLRECVYNTLLIMNKYKFKPTANELYYEVKNQHLFRFCYTLRSFVRLINSFPEIDSENPSKNCPKIYFVKL